MVTETNLGKWDTWYAMVTEPEPYALTPTYELGAQWLASCDVIEDWGCGKGWLRTLVSSERYRGIDGSRSSFVDQIVDLADYRSEVPGIFMRHVLEHDFRWEQILDNALASFTERMALILFTPLAVDRTHDLEWEDPPGVPNLSFHLGDLTDRFDAEWEMEFVPGSVKYGGPETIFYLSR